MKKILIFGATGMVGQGAVRECLLADDVEMIQTVGRTALGTDHPKLRNLIHKNLWDYQTVENELKGYDACFFCLGTSSAGKSEEEYTKVTHDLTLSAAEVLSRLNPGMTFIYISGEGADSTERSRTMWARVRGRTENDLKALPFKDVFMIRPGIIQPLHSIQSKTDSYRIFYKLLKPVLPGLKALFPNAITSTEELGRAMLTIARRGADKQILTNRDLRGLAQVG